MSETGTSDSPHGEQRELVRTQDFAVDGPIELDLSNTAGSITVELTERETVQVQVRHDRTAGAGHWQAGLSGLLSWVNEQFGDTGIPTGIDPGDSVTEAVRQTRIDLTGTRLLVRAPSDAGFRGVPLAITVQAPEGCHLTVRTNSGTVTVTGKAGRAHVQSGSGATWLAHATGHATVRSGSGQLRLGAMPGGVHARSGNGDVEITAIGAASSVLTGSGNVWLGELDGDVMVRSGSGDITIADAGTGQAELITGSGGITVAVRRGQRAELDLTSSTGSADSELPVGHEPPESEPSLRIFARTGSGDALVTPAM